MQEKTLYLTILENTQENYIHKNQVLSLDDEQQKYIFLFISPLFIIGRSGITINRNNFHKTNVIEVKIPLASYNFLLHFFLLPILVLFSCPVLFFYVVRYRPKVIHCRNLLSSFIALLTRKIGFFKYKIISDPRSVYPEEGVIIGRWKLNGINYKIWKKIESYTFKNVDYCIGLSENFKQYLQRFNKMSVYIPAIVNEKIFFDYNLRRLKRKELSLKNNDLVFIYVGSVGLWHSIDSMILMFNRLREKFNNYNCKIIALSSSLELKNRLRTEFGNDCLFCSSVSTDMVLSYLHAADFGLVPGSDAVGFHFDLLYGTMISSKAEEYICSGLPIICNDRIVELSEYVMKYNIGYLFNFSTQEFNANSVRIFSDEERKRISNWGIMQFGSKQVKFKLNSLMP